jgi:hypothetical protein
LVAALVILAAVLLGACGGTIGATLSLQHSLEDNGYGSVHVSPSGNSLKVSVSVAAVPSQSNLRSVAQIVWADFHETFDYCDVTIHGEGPDYAQDLSFGEMQQAFGARNPSWNRTSIQTSTEELGGFIIGGVVVLVVIIVVIIVMSRRRKRRRAYQQWGGGPGQPWAGGPGQQWAGPGFPAGPYQPGAQPQWGNQPTGQPGPQPQWGAQPTQQPYPGPASYPPGQPSTTLAPHPGQPFWPPPGQETPPPAPPPATGARPVPADPEDSGSGS